ncbi:MAG: zinc metallopeptidase [Thermomicrobiales bacterium]
MYFDPMYFIFLAPGLLLTLWANFRVRGAFAKYSEVPNTDGLTGAQVAARILAANGLSSVGINRVKGELSDYYDPRTRELFLSDKVYDKKTVAAMGVAAHEVGHALQHAQAYAPLQLRSAIVPAVSIGSNLGFIVLFAGLLLNMVQIAWLGVALFGLATLFALVTLPVEFNASKRAKEQLRSLAMVNESDARGVSAVLSAAAWTYIAGFATSLLTLLYYVMLVSGMSRDDR